MKIKRIISVILMISLLTTVFSFNAFALEKSDVIRNDKTGIPDKVLYQAILEELGRKKGTFTKKEVAQITKLRVSDKGVRNLSGIGVLENLEGLYINDYNLYLSKREGKLKSLAGIEDLKNLETLDVEGHNLTSLAGIENLTNLEDLYVSHNKLTNLNELKNLKNLVSVKGGDNKLNDISAVKNLLKLEYLNVKRNQLKRLPNLKKLTKLRLQGLETRFEDNKLSRKQLMTKLPDHLLENKVEEEESWRPWLKCQINAQNLNKTIKLTSPNSLKKINSNTKKITGKVHKNTSVEICIIDDDYTRIKTTKANKKGKFTLRNLNLKKYRGKKLGIYSYYYLTDPHEEESLVVVKFSTFIVKK